MSDCITKQCTQCKQEYPATGEYFTPCKRGKYGLFSWCKSCATKKMKERYKPHPKPLSTTEELKERKHARDKEYAIKHREEKADYHRNWTDKNRERVNAKTRDWAKAHPEYGKQRKSKRRARENNAQGTHTARDTQLQYKSQNGLCWWCGCELGNQWHEDHLIPLNRGGTDWANNIVCSCPKCNLSRADKLPSEWCGRLF